MCAKVSNPRSLHRERNNLTIRTSNHLCIEISFFLFILSQLTEAPVSQSFQPGFFSPPFPLRFFPRPVLSGLFFLFLFLSLIFFHFSFFFIIIFISKCMNYFKFDELYFSKSIEQPGWKLARCRVIFYMDRPTIDRGKKSRRFTWKSPAIKALPRISSRSGMPSAYVRALIANIVGLTSRGRTSL